MEIKIWTPLRGGGESRENGDEYSFLHSFILILFSIFFKLQELFALP